MFEQTFIDSRVTARRPGTMAASLVLQSAFVAAALAIPLFQTASVAWRPPSPLLFVPPTPKVVEVVQSQIASKQAVSLRPMFRPTFTAPTRIPTKISDSGPEPMPFMPSLSGSAGVYVDPLGDLSTKIAAASGQAQSVTPNVPPTPKTPLRVSVGVQAAKLIAQVKPPYPPLARTARVSGIVRLQAVIAPNGRIRNLQIISGHPLLVQAALDAVGQWQYQPTLLNGEPVEVITSIEVNFTLNQ